MVGTKKLISVIGIIAIVLISIFVGIQISHSYSFSVLVNPPDFSVSIDPMQETIEQDGTLQTVGYFSNDPGDDLRVAEKLASEFMAALNNGDLEKLVEISDTPFCFYGSEVVTTNEDLRTLYQEAIIQNEESPSKDTENVTIKSIQAMKIYELDENVYDISEIKILCNSVLVDENDIIVIMTLWVDPLDNTGSGYESPVGLIFKKTGQNMNLVAGFG